MSAEHFLFYAGAFALALGVLIVAHEFGHYLAARLCGVKVLRFSLGFGKPLFARRMGKDGTEWAIAAFPLGGYVKMLDEAEAPVAPAEQARAFNRQSVAKRILIVAAGPAANIFLAVVLYWVLFIYGVQEIRPVLAAPQAGTVAAQVGIASGDTVRAINGKPISTWQELRWELLNSALQRQSVNLELISQRHEISTRQIDTSIANLSDLDGDLLQQLGLELYRPRLKPVVGVVNAGTPAEQAGLRPGDEFVAIDGKSVEYSSDVTAVVSRASGRALKVELRRDGKAFTLDLTPNDVVDKGKHVGRIGIAFKDDPDAHIDMMLLVRYPPFNALGKALDQTWDTSVLYLKLVGRMISGQLSWKNLSGPVTIADYAGQSASAGLAPYLNFLALISISLGVLNLLPIPILDGGHLLYYLAEIIKGGPLPERVAEIGRQIGFALLVLLMIFAFYNDINRLIPI